MVEDVITPAKERIDAFRDMQKRFRDSWIITERSRLPIHNIMEPVPAEENEKDYFMGNPISKGFEGVLLTVLGVLMATGVGLFSVFLFIGACALMVFRILIVLSKKLLPVAILLVLCIIAYKLWML